MVTLSKSLAKIRSQKILVAGDIVLDRYTVGNSQRISPEAPVPVILVEREECKAGGAANVALNLRAMGMQPTLLGRIGNDTAGNQLLAILQNEGVDTSAIVRDNSPTPIKTRIIAGAQQLLRIDQETPSPLQPEIEKNILKKIPQLLEETALVAISDYAKGFLSQPLLHTLLQAAKQHHIISISDPKGNDFSKYNGSTILKPNASETLQAAHVSNLEEAANKILATTDIETLLVTRSENGISLFYRDGRQEDYPVLSKEIRDVTGAGDTVLAILSAACASQIPLSDAIPLANIAATCAIERIGCARISLYDIANHLIQHNPYGKVWTKSSFQHLQHIFAEEPLLFIRIPKTTTLHSDQLMKLTQITENHPEKKAIAYVEGTLEDPTLLTMLASLQSLQLIVHDHQQNFEPQSDHHLVVAL